MVYRQGCNYRIGEKDTRGDLKTNTVRLVAKGLGVSKFGEILENVGNSRGNSEAWCNAVIENLPKDKLIELPSNLDDLARRITESH